MLTCEHQEVGAEGKLLDLHICRVQGGSFLDSILILTTKIKINNNEY